MWVAYLKCNNSSEYLPYSDGQCVSSDIRVEVKTPTDQQFPFAPKAVSLAVQKLESNRKHKVGVELRVSLTS